MLLLIRIARLHAPPALLKKPMFGLTPKARISTSKSISEPSFICAVLPSKRSAVFESENLMPQSSRCLCTMEAQSSSRIDDSTRGARSQTVTVCTLSRRPSAHFSPIRPAPIISTRLFLSTACSMAKESSIVRKVNFFSTVSSPSIGGTKGDDPLQMHSLS